MNVARKNKKKTVKRKRTEYLEKIKNVDTQGKMLMACMGMKEGGQRIVM